KVNIVWLGILHNQHSFLVSSEHWGVSSLYRQAWNMARHRVVKPKPITNMPVASYRDRHGKGVDD
ncbi:MAG: hypothetical protein ACRDA1_04160, partial [Plesiomonas shigelloides]